MREKIIKGMFNDRLIVYPHLDPKLPDVFMASAGSVEAVRYDVDDQPRWGVRFNVRYGEPMTREKCDELQTALARCWQWIDEQGARERAKAKLTEAKGGESP